MGILAKTGMAAAISAFCLATGAAAKPDAPRSPDSANRDVLELAEALQKNDCDSVIRLGPRILDDRTRFAIPEEGRAAVLVALAVCEDGKGAKESAHAHAVQATRIESSSDYAWHIRYWIEVDLEKQEAAVATLEAMSQGRGAALNSLPMSLLWRLDNGLKDKGPKPLRARFLAVLAASSYDPDEMFGPADDFRLSYAGMLIDAGDSGRARPLVLGLRDPLAIGKASLDLRLRGFLPAKVDLRAAAEAELAVHREATARHPDRLEAVYETSQNLRQLGRPKEAFELLRAAEAKLDDSGAFTDLETELSWFWDHMARTYWMLGRFDDSLAAYAKGGTRDEHGNLNVSQLLNRAANLIDLGRNEEALRTIAVFDDPKRVRSPYGEMVLRWVRGCAHAFQGRRDLAAADLAFARAHEKDNRGAYARLLLCTGDMDGAAAAYIRRLDDPQERGDVLMSFSEFDDPPVQLPDPFQALHDAIMARPDVKAAIERAGGVRKFNIQGFHV